MQLFLAQCSSEPNQMGAISCEESEWNCCNLIDRKFDLDWFDRDSNEMIIIASLARLALNRSLALALHACPYSKKATTSHGSRQLGPGTAGWRTDPERTSATP